MHPRFTFPLRTLIASAMLFAIPAALAAQEAVLTTTPLVSASESSVVPHLIKYSGTLPSAPRGSSTIEVKFALYAAPTGGESLWSESQQVALDSSGKYSVLLGSVTALPSAAFVNGAARWIGVTLSGQEESARTILVATPYSLKASDAETLSGHPISDFTLKNALPASGTDITQINVGSGITGGGTGPTVTLGLSSTYLESLGNEIYPQLGGTNTLTGKNTYTAGNLLLGKSPVLSAANVTGTSPIIATVSGNTVQIGLSDSGLLNLGNSVYAQLGAPNTFASAQTFKSAVTFASGQAFPGTVALGANNAFTGTNSFSKAITFASGQAFPGTVALSGNNTFSGSNTFSNAITFAAAQSFPGTVALSANNAFTGTNSFSKAITFASGQTFPGAGTITSITTTSPLSGSGTSGTIALSLNTSSLETSLNGVYAQLGAADTFTNPITFAAGQTFPGTGTITGITTTSPLSGSGTSGSVPLSLNTSALETTLNGVYPQLAAANTFTAPNLIDLGNNVTGLNILVGDNSTGLQAYAGDGSAALLYNHSADGYDAVDIGASNPDSDLLVAFTEYGGECTIGGNGNFSCTGNYANVHSVGDRKVETYGVQSAENWIEDFGSGQLTAGSSHISLEPNFAATVNTAVEYHVFLTPEGESEQIYVTNKSADGFDVREARGGRSAITFDYRIVAKRKGFETVRMSDITERTKAHRSRRDALLGAAKTRTTVSQPQKH